MNRIIDISENPAGLKANNGCLLIRPKDDAEDRVQRIPFKEIAVIILAHPGIHLTHRVLSSAIEAGTIILTCDEKRQPSGMLTPLVGHHLQTERMAAQVATKKPVNKRIWKSIVARKIFNQSEVLTLMGHEGAGLLAMSKRVRSGDPQNLEAQAAKFYWSQLFLDFEECQSFRRRREGAEPNNLLNYGYAVLRSSVARAVVASGLHPSIGIHHHNRYNPFALVDDIMEPFRPLVDAAVVNVIRQENDMKLTPRTKMRLLAPLMSTAQVAAEQRAFFELLNDISRSVMNVYLGQAKDIHVHSISDFLVNTLNKEVRANS